MSFPRPGKALRGVMFVLFGVWLVFAIGINWGGLPPEVFLKFCGSTEDILRGEVWRLLTAPLMHAPSGTISHIVGALLGLYFLGTALEQSWGGKRFVRFLIASSVLAYALQMLVQLALPVGIADKLVGGYWFGAMPALEAVAIAWALSFRGRTVLLFMVVPVSSRNLILFVVGASVMRLFAQAAAPEGLVAPFGGMFAGWLLGGGTPSPLRRAWLKWQLSRLDQQAQRESGGRRERIARSKLRAIPGGRSGPAPDTDTKPRGGWLN